MPERNITLRLDDQQSRILETYKRKHGIKTASKAFWHALESDMAVEITKLQEIEAWMNAEKEKYDAEILRVQEHARETVLIPFCDKRDWCFKSGNGTYVFWSRKSGRAQFPDEQQYQSDKEFQEVVAVLDLPTAVHQGSYPHTLGETMEDYE